MEVECPICTLPKKELTKLPCNHMICKGCIRNIIKKLCPFCRFRFSDNDKKPIEPEFIISILDTFPREI